MDIKLFPEIIHGQSVILQKHKFETAPEMFAYVDKDRDRLFKFLPWVKFTKTVQDEINYIQMTHERWEKAEFFDYGLFERKTGTYMGNIGVHNIQWENECCELGYWILGDFEGKGFMSDAVTALEQVCFETGFHRVEIRCSSLNQRSASVPKRLGYDLDGILKQNAIEQGRRRDTLVFAKLNLSSLK